MRQRSRDLWGQPCVRGYRGRLAAGVYPTPRGDQSAGGSGGGAAAYAPLAWKMHQDATLEYPVAAILDANAGVFSAYYRGCGSDAAGQSTPDNRGLLGKILFGSDALDASHDAEHAAGFDWVIDNSAGNNGGGVLRSNVSKQPAPANGNDTGNFLGAVSPVAGSSYNDIGVVVTIAFHTNAALGVKQGVIAFNGVHQATFTEPGTWGAGQAGHSVAKWMINAYKAGQLTPGDFEAGQVYFHTLTNLSGIVTGTGSSARFVAAVLKKFYDPAVGMVDFGVDGSIPLGVQPLIFHDCRPGEDPQTAPLTNRGTLASPLLTAGAGATSANIKKLFRASIHPGEMTSAQPYHLWQIPAANSAAFGDTGSYSGLTNYGHPIPLNAKIVVVFKATLGGAAPTNMACASTNGPYVKEQEKTWSSGYCGIFSRDATAADVTANGQAWSAATKPVLTWTTGGGFVAMSCFVFVVAKPNGALVTITNGTPFTATVGAGGSFSAPSVTVPAGPGTLLHIFQVYGWEYEFGIDVPATGMQLLFKRGGDFPGGGGGPGGCWPYSWEKRTAYGSATATGTAAYATPGGSGAGNPYASFALAFT